MVSNIFYFQPVFFRKWSNLISIFQLGWNHQLATKLKKVISLCFFLSNSPLKKTKAKKRKSTCFSWDFFVRDIQLRKYFEVSCWRVFWTKTRGNPHFPHLGVISPIFLGIKTFIFQCPREGWIFLNMLHGFFAIGNDFQPIHLTIYHDFHCTLFVGT